MFISVDLPAPFSADQRQHLAAFERERHVPEDRVAPERLGEAGDAKDRVVRRMSHPIHRPADRLAQSLKMART